jgi:hypothetical protein
MLLEIVGIKLRIAPNSFTASAEESIPYQIDSHFTAK